MSLKDKQSRKQFRKNRVRSVIFGTKKRPRVSARASLTGMFVQFIDDEQGKTLVSGSDKGTKGTKTEKAKLLGKKLAEAAKKIKISSVVFDRGGNKYHGRVKALADAMRESGLKF